MSTAQQLRRRQGIGTRMWLVVSEAADLRHDEVTKPHIMRRTGLPARDLRVLDPALSYPSTILGRERAIVINLEHIKAVVTATEVLMLNSSNPLVVDFVDDLRHRISGGAFQQAKETNDPYCGVVDAMQGDNSGAALIEPMGLGPKSLPFEFKALEACLESACRCLESETTLLEREAYPALDELSSHISTLNLERVRQIKSRLVAISGRVQKVRDELEHLLDDDNDMAEMYLTDKLKQTMEQMSFKEAPNKDDAVVDEETDDDDSKSGRNSEAFTYFKPNVEELEMLLEAYFAQVDGISQKLSTMSEYVGDTEDYINIMLDDKQNQLLQMGVMLSTATMIINAGIVVVGLFGMNIHITLFDGEPTQFWETALGTTGGCIALYILAVGWGRKRFLFSMRP